MPNMDEVVRRMKEAYEPYRGKTGVPFVKAANDVLLLIEEREQDKAEIERLNGRLKWMEQIDMDRQADFELHAKSLRNSVIMVAEQDKEIQQFKTNAEYLQNVIDAKDEMLAWAERLVGSGPVPGMHYDPTNWLKEYRSTEYLERHTK